MKPFKNLLISFIVILAFYCHSRGGGNPDGRQLTDKVKRL